MASRAWSWAAPGALVAVVIACGPAEPGGAEGSGGSTPAPRRFPKAPVVLVSLDTCRADALSSQGGTAGVSPALDAFAAEAVVFEHARAQAPHTAPSHMSLFTSQYPSAHGVQNVQHGKDPKTGRKKPLIEAVPEALPTMAELFSAAGYRTLGLTDGGNLNAAHGFPRGFDEYTLDLSGVEEQVADGLARLEELAADARPYFLFWHTYEIHAPYVSPQQYLDDWVRGDYDGPLAQIVEEIAPLDFKGRFGAMRTTFWRDKANYADAEAAYMRELYDAGLRYTDDHFARLLDGLRAAGAYDEAIIVITSDHGEEFYEHGQWQHDQLYEETLRVPLMVRLPGGVGGGARIETPVALIDLLPTLMQLTGLEPAELLPEKTPRFKGRSLVPSLLDGAEPRARPIFSEVRSDRPGGPLYDWQIAIHHEGVKFLVDEYRGKAGMGKDYRLHELYELGADPGETTDLVPGGDRRVENFMQLRAAFKADVAAMASLERMDSGDDLSAEELRQLEELGYLEGDDAPTGLFGEDG